METGDLIAICCSSRPQKLLRSDYLRFAILEAASHRMPTMARNDHTLSCYNSCWGFYIAKILCCLQLTPVGCLKASMKKKKPTKSWSLLLLCSLIIPLAVNSVLMDVRVLLAEIGKLCLRWHASEYKNCFCLIASATWKFVTCSQERIFKENVGRGCSFACTVSRLLI